MPATLETPAPIQHAGEEKSNDIRRRLAAVEPHCIRTFTPSMAVLAKSAGSYHWTPEGRKLADFSSGVLVMNLGHNPTRWWQRVKDYLGLHNLKRSRRILRSGHAQCLQRGDRSRNARHRAAGGAHAKAARRRSLRASPLGRQRQRGDPKSPLGRPRPPRRRRHHPQHPPRLSRQKGLAGAVTGSEADTSATAASSSSAFPAKSASTSPAASSPST